MFLFSKSRSGSARMVAESDARRAYREWASSLQDIPVFLRPWWMDAVCAGKYWDACMLSEGGQPAAVPYLLRKRFGMRWIAMPQMTQIGGIWYAAPTEGETVAGQPAGDMQAIAKHWAEHLDSLGLNYYEQNFPIGSPLPQEMQKLGFKVRERVTYRLNDLSDIDKVIDNFSRNKKRQLHKALSLHAERGLDIETFYLFHSRCLGEKNKRISYTREFLLVLAKKCERNQCCETIAIRNADGELYAAGFVVWDTDAMHYLIAAQDEQHNDSGAMALLVLECIKLAREKGVKFDFEGSMIRGVARHFQQFGAKPAQYCCVYKYYSWWFAIVYWFYRLFTRDQR